MASTTKIFVKGIPLDMVEAGLEAAFGRFGRILQAFVTRDKETKQSRGFGFVTFECASDCEDAINSMNGKELNGSMLSITYAIEHGAGAKPSGPFMPRGGGRGGMPPGDCGAPRGGMFPGRGGPPRGRGRGYPPYPPGPGRGQPFPEGGPEGPNAGGPPMEPYGGRGMRGAPRGRGGPPGSGPRMDFVPEDDLGGFRGEPADSGYGGRGGMMPPRGAPRGGGGPGPRMGYPPMDPDAPSDYMGPPGRGRGGMGPGMHAGGPPFRGGPSGEPPRRLIPEDAAYPPEPDVYRSAGPPRNLMPGPEGPPQDEYFRRRPDAGYSDEAGQQFVEGRGPPPAGYPVGPGRPMPDEPVGYGGENRSRPPDASYRGPPPEAGGPYRGRDGPEGMRGEPMGRGGPPMYRNEPFIPPDVRQDREPQGYVGSRSNGQGPSYPDRYDDRGRGGPGPAMLDAIPPRGAEPDWLPPNRDSAGNDFSSPGEMEPEPTEYGYRTSGGFGRDPAPVPDMPDAPDNRGPEWSARPNVAPEYARSREFPDAVKGPYTLRQPESRYDAANRLDTNPPNWGFEERGGGRGGSQQMAGDYGSGEPRNPPELAYGRRDAPVDSRNLGPDGRGRDTMDSMREGDRRYGSGVGPAEVIPRVPDRWGPESGPRDQFADRGRIGSQARPAPGVGGPVTSLLDMKIDYTMAEPPSRDRSPRRDLSASGRGMPARTNEPSREVRRFSPKGTRGMTSSFSVNTSPHRGGGPGGMPSRGSGPPRGPEDRRSHSSSRPADEGEPAAKRGMHGDSAGRAHHHHRHQHGDSQGTYRGAPRRF